MSIDSRLFRDALGRFPTGVAVVTAGEGDAATAMTVNSFVSVSLEPPLVLWCVARRSTRYRIFTTAEHFTISLLAAGHREVSARLAAGGAHSLEGITLSPTEAGPPAIAESLAVFECVRHAVHPGGDHAVVIGEVLRFSAHNGENPLVFFRGRYGGLATQV